MKSTKLRMAGDWPRRDEKTAWMIPAKGCQSGGSVKMAFSEYRDRYQTPYKFFFLVGEVTMEQKTHARI